MTCLRSATDLVLLSWLAVVLLVPASAQTPAEIGELFASETTAQGPALLAGTGMSVVSGSEIAAGKTVATFRLTRGGEIRLCPNTNLNVSGVDSNVPRQNQALALSMDTGSLEFDYPLNDLADTLITPDFKIMLAGPGVFHFALGVSNKGDTCIQPRRGNSASLIISETLGNGVYQVKPEEAVVFSGGKLTGRGALESECGCPPPPTVMQAERPKAGPPTAMPPPRDVEEAKTSSPQLPGPEVTPLPPRKAGEAHVEVEAPLVYRGDQPAPAYTIAKIKFSTLPNVLLAQETQKPLVLKPGKEQSSANNNEAKGKEKKGFFGRIKGFFSALFHG